MKRLLLATDLSARSDRALERALQLAREHGAHLTVLHVVDEELPETVRTRTGEAAEAEIGRAVTKLGGDRDVDVSICVAPGRGHIAVLDAAARDDCDLIVLGRHRDESPDRPLRGTTMERVLRQGRIPVLVAAERADGPYARVMVAIDFSVFSRFAAKAALAVAPGAEIHFVHAFQVPFEGFLTGNATRAEVGEQRDAALARMIDAEMAAFLDAGDIAPGDANRIRRVLRNGEVVGVLRSEAARIRPDLLVMGTHGRVGIAHALLGSVAEDMLNRPPCDVLAVKAW